eukprot:7136897-Pyramimonas_sp.AAC.1
MNGAIHIVDNEVKLTAHLSADQANIPPRLQDYTIQPGGCSRHWPADLLIHRRAQRRAGRDKSRLFTVICLRNNESTFDENK